MLRPPSSNRIWQVGSSRPIWQLALDSPSCKGKCKGKGEGK